jgi:hypothetical protein
MISTVNGLQDTFAGPNYSPLPSDFVFNIHVDNTGDAVEDVTFQFVPGAVFSGPLDPVSGTHSGIEISVPIAGGPGSRKIKVALAHIGPVTAGNEDSLNYREHYQLRVVNGPLANNANIDLGPFATQVGNGSQYFRKPFDYAGRKSFPDYETYANSFIYSANIPGCAFPAKVFVGQRRDPFNINLGGVFDLVNIVPVEELGGSEDPKFNMLKDKAITAFTLEVHKSCIAGQSDGIVGAWASVNYLNHVGPQQTHTVGPQKNRLGNPLINELFIGLTQKDYWNYQHPKDEAYFRSYYEYPTLPELIEVLFGNIVRRAVPSINSTIAPSFYPRSDLLQILTLGIPGVNAQTLVGSGACDVISAPPIADLIRLNLNIAATPRSLQNPLGVIEGDNAGFPNGRRPGDDVVDIYLRVAMGAVCHVLPGVFCTPNQAPVGAFHITDRAPLSAYDMAGRFPYLVHPVAGSDLRGVCNPLQVIQYAIEGFTHGDLPAFFAIFAPTYKFNVNGFTVPFDARQLPIPQTNVFNIKKFVVASNAVASNPNQVVATTLDQVTISGGTTLRWFEQHFFTFDPVSCLVIQDDLHTDIQTWSAFINSLAPGAIPSDSPLRSGLGSVDTGLTASGIGAPSHFYGSPACDAYGQTRKALLAFEQADFVGAFAPLNGTFAFSLNGFPLPLDYRQLAQAVGLFYSSFSSKTLWLSRDPVNPNQVHFLSLDQAILKNGTIVTWFENHRYTYDPDANCKVVKDDMHADMNDIQRFVAPFGFTYPPQFFGNLGPLDF